MSFDPHSLERLRELGRQLPKKLDNPNKTHNTNKQITNNLNDSHPIETEKNPQILFQELID